LEATGTQSTTSEDGRACLYAGWQWLGINLLTEGALNRQIHVLSVCLFNSHSFVFVINYGQHYACLAVGLQLSADSPSCHALSQFVRVAVHNPAVKLGQQGSLWCSQRLRLPVLLCTSKPLSLLETGEIPCPYWRLEKSPVLLGDWGLRLCCWRDPLEGVLGDVPGSRLS
jgi:hypothetical protein